MKYERAVPRPLEYEFRANADGTDTFVGYAAVFDSDSEPLPFIESIAPGAFRRTLKSKSRKTFVVDHDDSKLISSTQTERLRLGEDSRGLHTESPLGDTTWSRDIRALGEAGELWGMSFSFRAAKNGEEWPDPGRRRLTDLHLGHVTVLTGLEPAYHATAGTVALRALALDLEADVDDIDTLLDAIRDGRTLSDEEYNLLDRLSVRVKPESAEPAQPEAEPDDPETAAKRTVTYWQERLAQREPAA